MVEVVKALGVLGAKELKREGGAVLITPPLKPEEVEAAEPLKPGFLAALEDGEEVAGEELWEPYRLAAFLVGLFPPPEGAVELAVYRPGRSSERVAVPPGDLVAHLLWRAQNLPQPERLWLGATAGGWVVDIELPPEVFLRVLSKSLGTEVLFLPEDQACTYFATRRPGALPLEYWVESEAGTYRGPDRGRAGDLLDWNGWPGWDALEEGL
jgi:hypothetical protein